jgi:uncharacterized protein YcnI
MSRVLRLTAILAAMVAPAFAHVTVQPKQSMPGATQRYALRVPTEKFVPTVRVEVEFPANLNVSAFELKTGWRIEQKRDGSGKITRVTLNGSLGPAESTQFYFTARNPVNEGPLVFKAIQVYEDGTKSEWTGNAGSKTPAPVVEIKK